jgi:type II secretory pathway pseudopilin PulG
VRNHLPRSGITLLELLVVLALLIILASVVLPSVTALWGNTRQKAAADTIRARLADARGRAMEHGVPFRLAVNSDGTRLRLGPDVPEFASLPADDPPSGSSKVSEDRLEKVTAEVLPDPDAPPPAADPGGWVTAVTFLPDGTAREDTVVIAVREGDFPPIHVRVRGVTGSVRVIQTQPGSGQANPGGAQQ